MSDLKNRLREDFRADFPDREEIIHHYTLERHQAADHIEELEAKLANLKPEECSCEDGYVEWHDPLQNETGWHECKDCNGTGKLPATHMIVPVKPTFEMLTDGSKHWHSDPEGQDGTFGISKRIYNAMIHTAQELD